MARVRLNRLDTDAYAQCFRGIFEQVGKDHPTFKVGLSLTGIIADWSDQQASGLEKAVGESVAKAILKGCQVCMCFVQQIKTRGHGSKNSIHSIYSFADIIQIIGPLLISLLLVVT